MKTIAKSLVAAAIGAAMLLAAPAGAADSRAWLERQFSTVHGTPPSAGNAKIAGRTSSSTGQGGSGHDFAAAWLERQFAGKPMPNAPTDDVARQARPAGGTDADAPGYVAWIRNQFPGAHSAPMNARVPSL